MIAYRQLDLVVIVADHHAKMLLDALIRRGQERGCLARFTYDIDLQSKHDAFFRFTEQFLPRNLPSSLHLLLCWDHHGCGREDQRPDTNERAALECVARHGVEAERALCVAFEPEVEAVYATLFDRARDLLAGNAGGPTKEVILRQAQRSRKRPQVPTDLSFEQALVRYPKEMLTALSVLINPRVTLGEVHSRLATTVSIPLLKGGGGEGAPVARIAAALQRWFPGPSVLCTEPPYGPATSA